MKDVLALIRIKHWLKNIIVFVPLCFVGIDQWYMTSIIRLLNVFISFCLSASMIYIFNDIIDRRADLFHPQKRDRPIASGRIKLHQALLMMMLLSVLLASVIIAANYLNYLVIVYIGLNLLYSLWLKKLPILDLIIVPSCYFLRVYAGAQTLQIKLSFWILAAIFFIALCVITGKRRSEILQENHSSHRQVLGKYNIEFLTYIILISAISAINSYVIYVHEQFAQNNLNRWVIFSVPVILFGVFKYLYNIFIDNQGGDPVEEILKDKSLILVLFLFFLFSIIFTSKIGKILAISRWFPN